MGIVDANMLFLHLFVGYISGIQELHVLQLSGIYQKINHKTLLSRPFREISEFLTKSWR